MTRRETHRTVRTGRPGREAPAGPIALASAAPATGSRKGAGLLLDHAYERLKWRILTMEYPPGTFLIEKNLCAELGLGRSPVHQALHRLQYDGLVEIKPRRGIIVGSWSPDELKALLEAREAVETTVVRLAAARATREQVAALRARLEEGEALIAARDREGLMRLDRDFHLGLAEMTGNAVLVDTVRALHQRSLKLWFIDTSDDRRYRAVQKQHVDILAQVARGNADRAEAALRSHVGFFASR